MLCNKVVFLENFWNVSEKFLLNKDFVNGGKRSRLCVVESLSSLEDKMGGAIDFYTVSGDSWENKTFFSFFYKSAQA